MLSAILAAAISSPAGMNPDMISFELRGASEAFATPFQEPDKPKDKGLQAAELKAYEAWLTDWQKRTGNTLSKKQIDELEGDVELGAGYVPSVEKDNKYSKDEAMVARVDRVGKEIADIAENTRVKVLWGDDRLNPFRYKFRVIEGKDVNAFSLPGGFIFVYEGLLKFVESDDELAAVLAHEISHASERHLATMSREQSKFENWALPAVIVAILSKGDMAAGTLVLHDLVATVQQSGWSVKAEKAADYGGFQFMLSSKYNPVAALTFMERLARDKAALEAIDWGIFRTHPPSRERADLITNYLTAAKIPIKRSLVASSFRVSLELGEDGSAQGIFGTRKLFTFKGPRAKDRANEAAKNLNDFFDQVPDLFEIQANADGTLVGRKTALLKFTLDDAGGDPNRLEKLASNSAAAVKSSLFSLAYRVWDVR